MDEYISKQRAKDLIGCCLASAKAEYKAAKDVFRKAIFEDYMLAMRSMIDVVGSVEAADVQLVRHGYWYHNTSKYISELDAYFIQACCSCCGKYSDRVDSYSEIMSNECCSHCGAIMDGDAE